MAVFSDGPLDGKPKPSIFRILLRLSSLGVAIVLFLVLLDNVDLVALVLFSVGVTLTTIGSAILERRDSVAFGSDEDSSLHPMWKRIGLTRRPPSATLFSFAVGVPLTLIGVALLIGSRGA